MIDNLTEAISHCKEVAEMNRKEAEELREYGEHVSPPNQPYNIPVKACLECAADHEQLVAWLEELKERREAEKARPQGELLRKEDVIHSIAKQYSEHNELVPIWLSIADMKGGAE